jgi:uncharacterized membrane protein YhaH (DUF805 family)
MLNDILSIILPLSMFLLVILLSPSHEGKNSIKLPPSFGIPSIFMISYMTLYSVTCIRLNIARLHDFNYRGIWCLIFLIPLIGLIIAITLRLIPGTLGTNRFGEQPQKESILMEIVSAINFTLTSGLIIISPLMIIYAKPIVKYITGQN